MRELVQQSMEGGHEGAWESIKRPGVRVAMRRHKTRCGVGRRTRGGMGEHREAGCERAATRRRERPSQWHERAQEARCRRGHEKLGGHKGEGKHEMK